MDGGMIGVSNSPSHRKYQEHQNLISKNAGLNTIRRIKIPIVIHALQEILTYDAVCEYTYRNLTAVLSCSDPNHKQMIAGTFHRLCQLAWSQ